jgi:hypothetical protein
LPALPAPYLDPRSRKLPLQKILPVSLLPRKAGGADSLKIAGIIIPANVYMSQDGTNEPMTFAKGSILVTRAVPASFEPETALDSLLDRASYPKTA